MAHHGVDTPTPSANARAEKASIKIVDIDIRYKVSKYPLSFVSVDCIADFMKYP
jgi:hypothetical protein